MQEERQVRCMNLRALLVTGMTLVLVSCGVAQTSDPAVEQTGAVSDIEIADEIHLNAEAVAEAGIRIEHSREIEIVDYLETTGTVAPDESRVVHLRTLGRGIINEVYVRRGDRVLKGQPLVQIDYIELGELVGQYLSQHLENHRNETDLEVARKFWERGVELLQVQAIARKEVELREAEYRKAQAMIERQLAVIENTEEKLHRFGLTEEEIQVLNEQHTGGHRTASYRQIEAPSRGVILEYDVAPGEVVEPTEELMTIADLSRVWVLANVYEKDLGIVTEGQLVEVSTGSYPDRVFQGKLTYVSDVLNPATRSAQVRCVVANPNNLLKLEMFVAVRIPSTQRRSCIAVPAEAIQNIDGEDVVFVSSTDGRFRRVTVETGLEADNWIEVTGIEAGIPVVSTGSFYLKSTLKRSAIGVE